MEQARQLIENLKVVDWTGDSELTFGGGLSPDTRVGELLAESVKQLNLPKNLYTLEAHGKRLNANDTLEDAGIQSNTTIGCMPEVTAG